MMTDKKRTLDRKDFGKRPVFVAILVLLLLSAGIAFAGLRIRGGRQVKPSEERTGQAAEEVILYRQDDERWSADRLGQSKYTMGSSGCLVSCIASALSMESGEEVTPGALNAAFSAENVYDGEGNLQWEPLAALGEYGADVYGEVSREVIDGCLSEGHFPIARVRMYALGNFHYVLIVGVEDGEYLCMDPLQDEVTKLSRYGNRVYALRCVYPIWGSFQGSEEENGAQNEVTGASIEKGGISLEGPLPKTDLNRNGIPEELRVAETEDGDGMRLEVWEAGEKIFGTNGYDFREGQTSVFLCRLNGEDYLLRYHPDMYQGCGDYSYSLFSLEEGGSVAEWAVVSFDINFGSLFHEEFDREAVAAFMKRVNSLLAHSIQLLNTEEKLLETFEREGKLEDTLWWLEEETGFTRDPSKSLVENLQDFQAAMSEEKAQASFPGSSTLPFEEPLEMMFCSGAGAWRTMLTLYPDGTFRGEYTDSDMGSTGEGYPHGSKDVCQFHGCFGDFRQVSDASFSMVLKELEIDTEYPVGEEWIEDGVRYISSEPYGLDGEDWKASKPGAAFLFYTPEVTGYEPGTELYGAVYFCNWRQNRREFQSAEDTLGCYGLHNLETGYGFFSEEVSG